MQKILHDFQLNEFTSQKAQELTDTFCSFQYFNLFCAVVG